MTNAEFLDIIKRNIHKHGYHITLVNGGQNPDFSYSIGLSKKFGFELVIAGGFDSIKENERIFKTIFQMLESGTTVNSQFSVSENDAFFLGLVDSSWCKKLLLGVYDYYKTDAIKAYQIRPIEKTKDTPLMSNELNTDDAIWKWLDMNWNIDEPKNSYVITDINALKGQTITEVMRWENHVWEMFSGPGSDVEQKDIRIVPLGTILGIDTTLQPILNLKVEEGLWRDHKDSSWQDW